MLNENTIALMKSNVIVINTARGKLINETALYNALVEGNICSAGLDVHYEEPIQKNNHLLSLLDNVIMTPHIAGLSFETFYNMMNDAVDNIVTFDRGLLDKIIEKRIL